MNSRPLEIEHVPRPSAEELLVRRAAVGDPAAIRVLYDRNSAQLFSVVRRIVGDSALAEDCAQDAWVRALRALPNFRGEAKFSTWIHRIAVNVALRAVRRGEKSERLEAELPSIHAVAEPGGDVLLRDRLERMLERLPAGMRKVIVLHDVEAFTHEEIGQLLGISPGTSKSQLFKARARMRELLGST